MSVPTSPLASVNSPLSAAETPDAPRAVRAGWDTPTLALLVFGVVCFFALARATLSHWWGEYTQPESYYAHAPIIPFLVALMFWHRRAALQAVPKAPNWGALGALLPLAGLLVIATKEQMPAVETVGLLGTVWSSVWLVLGTRFVKAAVVPLGFLVCMAPLPGPLLNDATFSLQQLSTHGAVTALRWLQFHPSLSGNVITLDNYTVFIDVPCSGFKLLLSLLTSSAALAFLLDGPARRRLALFLISLPLSLGINIVRLTLLCVVGECISTPAASVFHDWDGLLTLLSGVVLLFVIARRMGCRTFAGWPLF